MEIDIKQDERIDDLQCRGLKIIQNKNGFCFGVDAVLLANFAQVKKGQRVIDLGTGTGIIPILIAGKTNAEYAAVLLNIEFVTLIPVMPPIVANVICLSVSTSIFIIQMTIVTKNVTRYVNISAEAFVSSIERPSDI
jgi:tRNA1(Val) A37 N6-methylase TrmN6